MVNINYNSRRDFLKYSASMLFLMALPGCSTLIKASLKRSSENKAKGYRGFIFSGRRVLESKQEFGISAVDLFNNKSTFIKCDYECHSALVQPKSSGKVVLLGRKPGVVSCELDLVQGKIARHFYAEKGRHFYGHGVYSLDGRVLYTTENDYDSGVGVIVARDSSNFKILSEFPSFGVGPHDVHLVNSGKTLVVAHGGQKRHPNYHNGKKAYNIGSLEPSLSYIDISSEKLIDKFALSNKELGIKHLKVTPYGVVFCVQNSGNDYNYSLVYLHKNNGEILPMSDEGNISKKMRHHTLSVAYRHENNVIAVTSPAGNSVAFWSLLDGALLKVIDLEHPLGVVLSSDKNYFIVSLARKGLVLVDVNNYHVSSIEFNDTSNLGWASHLLSV